MTEKWKFKKRSNGGTYVSVDGSPVGIPQEVCRVYNCSLTEQRAKLIANAPAVLELVNELRDALTKCATVIGSPRQSPEELWMPEDVVNDAWNSAESVLAKAKEVLQ